VSNWAKEFDQWIGRASQPKRVVIKKGGEEGLQQIRAYFGSMKRQQMNQTGQVLIISYDLFRMNADQFQTLKTTVGLLVVDEGHRLKNTAGSATLTALESLQSDTRLCITATPIQNNLTEFYSLANFACPGILGDLSTFRRDYERPISASNNKSATSEQRTLGALQSRALEDITKTFMLRRLQKEILKTMLPPRIEALLFCRPSERQCELYRTITSQSGETGSFSGALVTLTALRKLCSHPSLCKEGDNGGDNVDNLKAAQLSGKLVVLDALLQSIRETAPGDKVVIVSNFTSALSTIESLVLNPRQYSFQRLDGTTDLQNRQPMVDSFNRSTPEQSFCLLLSSKAGGCGLNLIGANRLVMFDPDWNPALDVQAMGRVYRQGQTKPCTIYRLFTSGTVEEVIYQRQSQKGNLATLTVDGRGGQNSSGRFTKEEIADCFTLKENCDCDTKRKLGSRWAAYDGPDSLQAQGCTDDPLLDIAETLSESLAFVHIVDDDEVVSPEEGDPVDIGDVGAMESGDDSDSDDEGDPVGIGNVATKMESGDDSDSDDECEF
jgi:SNF2 family DNA or RNA helicase